MVAEIAVLVNPTSGRGKGARLAAPVTEHLRAAGLKARWEAGRDADEAADLARRWVARGIEGLVVVGGDGMLHMMLQAVAGSRTTLGVVPAGTGNDLARALGVPRTDPLAATDIVIAGHTRQIDLAKVDGQWISTILCAGIDSRVSERVNRMSWPRGRLRYDLGTVIELRDLRPRPYVVEIDGDQYQLDALSVAVGNTPTYGGGIPICPRADPSDGLLDVTVIGAVGYRRIAPVYMRIIRGTHHEHPAVSTYRGKRISVAAPGVTAFADGERIGALPLTLECVPAAANVFAPPPR